LVGALREKAEISLLLTELSGIPNYYPEVFRDLGISLHCFEEAR
jgi:hypothetical protein